MVKEGWRDKEMNISKNAVKKKIFTSYPNKKKMKRKCFYLNVHRNIHLTLYPFCASFMKKKERERYEKYGNIQNRKGVARVEQGQLMMISESLV